MGGIDSMSHVIIPKGDGYICHMNVDIEKINLSDDAEVYETRSEFDERLSDF